MGPVVQKAEYKASITTIIMKKINLFILTAAAGIVLAASSCRFRCLHGSGNQITENRNVGDYKGVSVSDAFKVIIKQDSSSKTINVTADDNIIKFIRTNVDNGVLHIYIKKNVCNSGEIIVKVPVTKVEELRAGDASEITSDGKIIADDVHIGVSDGSRISLDLTAKHVTTRASDSGELDLKGQAAEHDLQVSDGSKVYAKEFVTNNAVIRASDGSECEVNILNSLNVRGSDGSVVKYFGNPQNVNTNKSDGASVEKGN